jgi:hypothetical protein
LTPAARSVALPPEHGGWGFVGEAALLGLLLAPSWPGAALALAGLSLFLARHPAKLLLNDAWRGQTSARTSLALRFGLCYGLLAVFGLMLATASAGVGLWAPLLAAAPLAAYQLARDSKNRGRERLPELLGAAAPGALSSAIAVAGGFSLAAALTLWLLLAARATASTLYVRARLRLDRGVAADCAAAWASHAFAFATVAILAALGHTSWLAAAAFAPLLMRAVAGLSPGRTPVRPQRLGLQEVAYGLLTVGLVVLGQRL